MKSLEERQKDRKARREAAEQEAAENQRILNPNADDKKAKGKGGQKAEAK